MRLLSLLLLGLLAAVSPCSAQAPASAAAAQSVSDMPQWLVDFSNLPRLEREEYLRSFAKAKQAYQQGQWVICIGHLADCEMIFRGNPNVWNLRACCLMEQKFFPEAAEELKRVRKAIPNDPVTTMNLANLQIAQKQYQESINTLRELRNMLPYGSPQELLNVLTFRELLCHVMLGQEQNARELIKDLTPISDTPLYYYSQAVFALAQGNKIEASRNLRVVASIFANGSQLVPYQRAMELSGIADMATGQ